MRRQTAVLAVLGLFLGGTLLAGADANARPRKTPPRSPAPRGETFTVSGEFTGPLEGTIVLNGDIYYLGAKASIQELGRVGPLPAGTFLSGRRVTLAGVERGGARIVNAVIVRPDAPSGTFSAGQTTNVGVLRAGAPQ